MRRIKRGAQQQEPLNIETHHYNELILPQFRIKEWEIVFLRDNMPTPDFLYNSKYDWMHILHMLVYASQLCEYSRFDMEVVRWAIWTHDSGHYHDDIPEDQHGLMSAYVAANMMERAECEFDRGKIISIVGRHSRTDESISTEEAALRAADRLDCWRLPGFSGIDDSLMDAPGWRKVEKMARELRLQGGIDV